MTLAILLSAGVPCSDYAEGRRIVRFAAAHVAAQDRPDDGAGSFAACAVSARSWDVIIRSAGILLAISVWTSFGMNFVAVPENIGTFSCRLIAMNTFAALKNVVNNA
jgi:hypothetical protein